MLTSFKHDIYLINVLKRCRKDILIFNVDLSKVSKRHWNMLNKQFNKGIIHLAPSKVQTPIFFDSCFILAIDRE